jgi:hypothetical protein
LKVKSALNEEIDASVCHTPTGPGVASQELSVSYVRVSILGTFSTEEVWSINPVFDPTGEFGDTVDQTALDSTTLAIANLTIPTGLRSMMSLSATRTGARVEVRDDVDDHLIGISIQASTTPLTGSGTLVQAPQTAVVTSIRTNTPGASGRGRVYWPAMGASLTTAGRLNTPSNSLVVADMKTYLLGIRSALAAGFPLIGFDLAVRSKTTHTTPHAVRIQVGNVLDTQRRRRDSLPESYVAATFP